MNRRLIGVAAGLAATLAVAGATPASATVQSTDTVHRSAFVVRSGDDLKLSGRPFRFTGSNNYYLMYKTPTMVDDVFGDAKAANFNVLRTWGFLDINTPADSADGVYFQFWDGAKPAYNDGATGLEHLDYVLAAAGRAGIKLVIPLTNNWSAFGGMDQYVRWRGGQHHDDFYTDATIRGWYKDWISHVLNRTNTLTGIKYKDDPAVAEWELANEPRCIGSGAFPRSATCTTQTLVDWARDISGHIKSVDRNHLVGSGDEGFLCTDPSSSDWTINCGEGVDAVALAKLPAIDLMSFHLYPDGWGKDAAFGVSWIKQHATLARQIHKPVMLGEFGFLDKSTRNPVYKQWGDAAVSAGLDGYLYWILSGVQDDGTLYPDFDGFTVYCPSPVCTTLSNTGAELRDRPHPRNPVADHDAAQTLRGDSVTLAATANDIAYRTRIKPRTLDLDPATAGRQTTAAVTGGTFVADNAGVVTFTPTADFVGRATATYTVKDEAGRLSNVAEVRVLVKNRPGDALVIESWETGPAGWASANWQSNAGTVGSSTEFHPHGALGLEVVAADGGWFGLSPLPEPIDLSGKSFLRYELRTTTVGTSTSIAVQTGSGFVWCQSTWGFVNAGTTSTVEVDLTDAMSCDAAALADVQGIYLWFSGGGTFDADYLRAE